MAERQVTVDRDTHPMPQPFTVLATQNPVEMDGTYRLPEAQLDRFMLRMEIGYPSREAEVDILRGSAQRSPDKVRPVGEPDDVVRAIEIAKRVQVHDAIYRYIADVCARTRQAAELRLGASPRGGISLLAAARALAMLEGRGYVVPEDVLALAEPVLAHRMIATPGALREGRRPAVVLREVLDATPAPGPGTVRRGVG
jgi:MoxR-like ATPase